MSSLDKLVSNAVNNVVDKYMNVFLSIVSEKYSIDCDELHNLFRQNVSFSSDNTSTSDYEKMTLKELREVCKMKNIKKVSTKRKSELINLLNDFDQSSVNAIAQPDDLSQSISDSETLESLETNDDSSQRIDNLSTIEHEGDEENGENDVFHNNENNQEAISNINHDENIIEEEVVSENNRGENEANQNTVIDNNHDENIVEEEVVSENNRGENEANQNTVIDNNHDENIVEEEVVSENNNGEQCNENHDNAVSENLERHESIMENVQSQIQEPSDTISYSKMNVDALKKLCKERSIKGIRGKNKKQLIELLSQPSGKQRCNSMIDLEEDARNIRSSIEGSDENIEEASSEEVNYYRLTIEELRDVCKIRGVDVRNKKKNQLIETLTQFERNEENFDTALINDSDIF